MLYEKRELEVDDSRDLNLIYFYSQKFCLLLPFLVISYRQPLSSGGKTEGDLIKLYFFG